MHASILISTVLAVTGAVRAVSAADLKPLRLVAEDLDPLDREVLTVFAKTENRPLAIVPAARHALSHGLADSLRSLRLTPSWPSMVTRHYGASTFDVLARAHLTD